MERLNNETLKSAISVYETTVKAIEEHGIDDPDYCPALDKSTLSFLKELKEYREAEKPVKPIHTRYRIKSTDRMHHMIYCGKCGEFGQRVSIGDNFCRHCGTPIDWSE